MAKVPIVHQTFAAFAGDDESIALLLLSAGISHRDSINVYVSKIARLARILGYLRQGTAYTTNVGGSPTKLPGLFPYSFATGGVTTLKTLGVFDDASDEYEVVVSTDKGANWTLLEDLGSGFSGKIPDSAAFGNLRYLTFGKGTPRVYNSTALASVGVTQSPKPTIVTNGAGILSGSFEYKVVSMKPNKDRQGASEVSTEIIVSLKKHTVSWTADTDGTVIGYEIYRTTGTGELFYLAGTVEGRLTVTFEDNVLDSVIFQKRILQEHGDPPPDGVRFCEPHETRMWWLGTDEDPRKAFYSDRGRAEEVGAASFLDLTAQNGGADKITGGTGNFFRSFIIWLEQSVWRVSGTGTLVNNVPDLRREQTSSRVGTVSSRSVVKVPENAVFTNEAGRPVSTSGPGLAFFTPNLDIRVLDGDADTVVSTAKSTFLATVNWDARDTINAIHHPTEPAIIWFVPTGVSTVPNAGVMWNYAQGVWTEIDTTPFLSSMLTDDRDALVGSNSTATGGLTYKWWNGNTFDGANITSTYFSKPIFGHSDGQAAPHLRKRSRRVDLVFSAHDSSRSVTFDWFTGFVEAGATVFGTKSLSLLDATGSHVQVRAVLKNTSGNYPVSKVIRFRVTDTGSGDPWELDHFIYHFQVLPGMTE